MIEPPTDASGLLARAHDWLAGDPDPETRAELGALLEAEDLAGLAARFGPGLAFGTAGIRGPIGAGPARMNRLVVRRVTAGLAERLRAEPAAEIRGVVLGRDARHKSADFADEAARTLAAAGVWVHRFPEPVPTPLVAFTVRLLGAAAGVQITASHNPPADNGYKVYWGDGAQIVSPLDEQIAEAIARAGQPWDVAVAEPDDDRITRTPPDVVEAYLGACLQRRIAPAGRALRIVYTPLHGVAGATALELLRRAGYDDVAVVAGQAEPDPDFPTVAFPNPEEPGALDLALALARERDADLVLANDPDGDRIAAAVPDGAGGHRVLSGDEVGCLLAEHVLTHGPGGDERMVATTVVSSRLLSRIAADHGVGYRETLTGFKWLAREAVAAERAGRRLVLAYEQALGVMVGDLVRDKDGLSAALALADLVAWLAEQGVTVADALDDLARRHGVHATAGRNLRLEGPDAQAMVGRVLGRLREGIGAVGGSRVVAVADYAAGIRRFADGALEELAVPSTDLVALELEDGSLLQARPSGTEPLLKLYLEVVEPVEGAVADARARAQTRLAALGEAFLEVAAG